LEQQKSALFQIPAFYKLSVLQKEDFIHYAQKQFGTEITERLNSYAENVKKMFNVDKYINQLK
jgi:hypothetical protein